MTWVPLRIRPIAQRPKRKTRQLDRDGMFRRLVTCSIFLCSQKTSTRITSNRMTGRQKAVSWEWSLSSTFNFDWCFWYISDAAQFRYRDSNSGRNTAYCWTSQRQSKARPWRSRESWQTLEESENISNGRSGPRRVMFDGGQTKDSWN